MRDGKCFDAAKEMIMANANQADVKKVGVIVGREWSFPPALLEEINSRNSGVVAEYAKLGGTRMNEPCPYAVLVDRISHEIPYYRAYLKNAMLQGAYVINNPFWWSADDKFFEASLATRLGVASPKTMVLPMKSYPEGVVTESLRNLMYPLDWHGITGYIGLPAILKDTWGGGWKHVYKVNTIEELVHAYDQTGTLCMILQEFIEWDHYVRCICVGQEKIMPIKYDPGAKRYLVEHEHLSPALGERIVQDARLLNQALGYDMNSVEFAVRDSVPYAIDFMNPAPDMDINSITPHYFEWAVKAMADLCIEMAHRPRPQRQEQHWAQFV
jgi:glutathione synthase/RimK-type ligase-like ATP-grasp enzyme